jgi:vitamin B12 transporter
MPTAQQLTGNYYNSANVHIVGNPDLKPETSLSYEGGFDIFLNYLTLSATYFNSDYENMILQKNLSSSERTYENVESAKMSGLEFELNFDVGSFLGYDFSLRPYTNMTRLFSAKNRTQDTYLQNIAKYTIGYGLDLDFPEQHLSIDIHGNYSGHEYARDYGYLMFPNRSQYGWISGHNTFDISLQKRLISFEDKGRLDLKVRVENVFDKYYQPVPYYPQPGRNFYVGLRYVY